MNTILKLLRIQNNFTQEQIAQKLNITRVTYNSIEQNQAKLNIDGYKILSEIYGVEISDLVYDNLPEKQKFKEMIIAFLREGADDDGFIPKTKLAKLLYLADFTYFYDNLKSISSQLYKKMSFGPVAKNYFSIIDEMLDDSKLELKIKEKAQLLAENKNNKNQKLTSLSKLELDMIKKIANKWRNVSTKEIVNFTHNQLPYLASKENQIINYDLITQHERSELY